jgi:hypothetical protein
MDKVYLGDCLDIIPKHIVDKSVDLILCEDDVISMYLKDKMTLRYIAKKMGTNHHKIKRILIKNGIVFDSKTTIKIFTDEHKKNISESCKGRKSWCEGKKMSKDFIYKNMRGHLKYKVSLEWLMQFTDIEKLKFLNKSISRKRDYEGFTDNTYMEFIGKFYYDQHFNYLYDRWINTGDKWIKPSLDHIIPKSKKGGLLLDNLQFISWLENRTKIDINQYEWNEIKKRIHEYF